MNISEMFDKILLKPPLRYDLQRLCLGVVHLNVPEICTLQSDRGVEDFLKKRLKVIDGEQTGAELMEAGHRCQFGSEFISQSQRLFLSLLSLSDIFDDAKPKWLYTVDSWN